MIEGMAPGARDPETDGAVPVRAGNTRPAGPVGWLCRRPAAADRTGGRETGPGSARSGQVRVAAPDRPKPGAETAGQPQSLFDPAKQRKTGRYRNGGGRRCGPPDESRAPMERKDHGTQKPWHAKTMSREDHGTAACAARTGRCKRRDARHGQRRFRGDRLIPYGADRRRTKGRPRCPPPAAIHPFAARAANRRPTCPARCIGVLAVNLRSGGIPHEPGPYPRMMPHLSR